MSETGTVVFELGGTEVSECLPNLRYVPGFGMNGPVQVLQQAWRVSVVDGHGKTMGSRIEWRPVPLEANPR